MIHHVGKMNAQFGTMHFQFKLLSDGSMHLQFELLNDGMLENECVSC